MGSKRAFCSGYFCAPFETNIVSIRGGQFVGGLVRSALCDRHQTLRKIPSQFCLREVFPCKSIGFAQDYEFHAELLWVQQFMV